MDYKPLSDREEEIGRAIVEAAYVVHKYLGPGLLEKVYEVCFCHEISKKGFHPVRYTFDRVTTDEGIISRGEPSASNRSSHNV